MKLITKDNLGDIDRGKYYGVVLRKDQRGFVTRTNFTDGKFTIRCFDNVTEGNGWVAFDKNTLREFFENLFTNQEYIESVYEFDDYKPLIKWTLEGKD